MFGASSYLQNAMRAVGTLGRDMERFESSTAVFYSSEITPGRTVAPEGADGAQADDVTILGVRLVEHEDDVGVVPPPERGPKGGAKRGAGRQGADGSAGGSKA